ncbi:MAG TPA: M14 family zinc carboxypeptidase [Candidatus Angelobacter sp.]|nr:M14 family zinc carboxypeptidase [Candidatus Angelobacter sp.]
MMLGNLSNWRHVCLLALILLTASSALALPGDDIPERDPKQPIDAEYSKKIMEYTTQPMFTSPLVDYLPASKTVPTPKAVLGDVAGAPGILPYSKQVYEYMRMLEKASPRVKVFSIGRTEEGREMIAVAVSSEANLAHLEENRARLAKLADPRTIKMDDAEAERIISTTVPVYYITGTIHSPETGAPTALMELAYRLAVDESPYIKDIRNNLITLITPIVEVDGRDRMVDLYRWHLAHPKDFYPPLLYWGKYVAHDNNRDAMAVSLKLTENVLNTFVGWKAQVLHDLHESVPYLYDNTAGDGPFNAWVDPILTNEWEILGWRDVADMTRMGMPGVFTHGNFDTWSPGYLMFIAAMHNGISRLYETFGNGGADTVERQLRPEEYARTWYRQDPPLPKIMWSQRNNNNYEETGLLTSLNYFAKEKEFFLKNFYLKAKRSISKPSKEGPAAYVFPADDPRPGAQAALLEVLRKQGCEISRATAAFTVKLPAKKPAKPAGATEKESKPGETPSQAEQQPKEAAPTATPAPDDASKEPVAKDVSSNDTSSKDASAKGKAKPQPITVQVPAGSYIVRMDQPYSRVADALLDHQYWSPNDPQKTPYDDTGWTFGELFNVRVLRVVDAKVLETPMEPVNEVKVRGGISGGSQVFVINANGDTALATLRYRLKDASIEAAEEPFEAEGHKFARGSFIISKVDTEALRRQVTELGLQAVGVAAAPKVKSHPLRAARVALLHTWLSTQGEGWWRMALDQMQIPYSYISTQQVAREDDLRSKYDVILFPPTGRGDTMAVVNGLPMSWGNALPWKNTPETPNIGKEDSTDDIRPGLGWSGVEHLENFVQHGGVLVTVMNTANLAVDLRMAPGVAVEQPRQMKIVGSILKSVNMDAASPIAYGFGDNLPVYCDNGPIFNISNVAGSRGGPRRLGAEPGPRPTGRGGAEDPDFTPGRPITEAPEDPHAEPWEAQPLNDEQRRNNFAVIPPADRPRVIFRYADAKDLLISGLLEGGNEIAQRPAVVDVPVGNGHVVLFSTNPIYRAETIGNYSLVLNTLMNFDNLNVGRKLADK